MIRFRLNGREVQAEAPPTERLSLTLRERLGLRDTKVGCDAGDCGACTVLVDGRATCACMVPAARVTGAHHPAFRPASSQSAMVPGSISGQARCNALTEIGLSTARRHCR